MTDALAQFVLANINCTPGQDKELVLKPVKLQYGPAIFGTLFYLRRNIDLPNKTSTWFVYQIGTYYENQDDQLPLYQHTWEYENWVSLTKPLTTNNVLTTLYTAKGITFPLFRSFYMFTREKALLIAIEQNGSIPADLKTDDLYIRFYRNAFYDSTRAQGTNYNLQTGSMILGSSTDINAINTHLATLTQTTGYAILSVNGQRYKSPDTNFVGPGDLVEWVYDPTIEHVEIYILNNAPVYTSTLDGENKILLHSPTTNYFTTIQYQDDLEIDFFTPISSDSLFGVHYPIFDDTSIRMLSHRDYGLRSSIVNTLTATLTSLNPSVEALNIRVEVKFRKSGWNRPLFANTSLIEDLYTLPDSKILSSFSQTGFPTFSAPVLEGSPYIQSIASPVSSLTQALAEQTLGYNETSNIFGVAATKVVVNGSAKTVPIPAGYQASCTGYEYNFTGQFLEYHNSSGTDTYSGVHPNCNIVELIKGASNGGPSGIAGNNNLAYNPGHGYRVFACTQTNNVPNFDWSDITNTSDYSIDTNANIVSWTNPNDPRYLMIRDDSKFTVNTTAQTFSNLLMMFTLTEYFDQGQGSGVQSYTAAVPGSIIDLFLNTRSLIPNLDYFVSFPNVYITSFKYLNQNVSTANQNIHYRITGLGDGSGQFEPVFDKGQIVHGFVGTRGTYVPKNDKPYRVIIDGYLKVPTQVKFSQDNLTASDPANVNNGLVYQVQPYIVPITEYLNENQELLRLTSKALDVQLVNYMQLNFSFPVRAPETVVASPYVLVCPFHSKIADDLIADVFTSDNVDPARTDNEIRAIIAPYLYLINVSPSGSQYEFVGNSNYVIFPHARLGQVSLGTNDANKINFITRVSALATPGAISNVGNYFS